MKRFTRRKRIPLEIRVLLALAGAALVLAACSGSEGPPGSAGAAGKDGAAGAAGKNGANGKDGLPGSAGANGTNGTNGTDGTNGTNGTNGVACWDLNANGTCDPATEDKTGDLLCDALDCKGDKGDPGEVVVPDIPPELAKTNVIAFHKGITDQTSPSLCVTCHGSMKNLYSLDPSVKKLHSRKFEVLGEQPCTFCHGAVDLLNKSGATLRKQVDVKAKCFPCHSGDPKFYESN